MTETTGWESEIRGLEEEARLAFHHADADT